MVFLCGHHVNLPHPQVASIRRFDSGSLSPDSFAPMRIAFYAPLKSPNHPVVSGDRQVARLLMRALALAGHTVEVASELRAYLPEPDFEAFDSVRTQAAAEVERLAAQWRTDGGPDLWFTYHPYYKSPDLIGPELAAALSIPYVTAEASYSSRRAVGAWAMAQSHVVSAVRNAALNLCLTRRDHDGLAFGVEGASLAMLPPFIDMSPFAPSASPAEPARLATVAMMRSGDKLDSYRMLAAALPMIEHLPWTLSIVGDGPCRGDVERLFDTLPPERIAWHGRLSEADVAAVLASSAIYVWPGCGEAFGLAYLEAQAAGLPVVAQATAGVPEVVPHGETGLLTPDGDIETYAAAIRRLLLSVEERQRLGQKARRHVAAEHSLEAAAALLARLLPRRSLA
jgi:glycosyltransferase involved in cell wall biosynthesis